MLMQSDQGGGTTLKVLISLVVFFIATALAQVLLKVVAIGPGGSDYQVLVTLPLFYVCCLFFGIQGYAWILVLKVLPLSRAYPISSLNVVFTLVCAAVFFGESVTPENIAGSILIVLGIIVLTKPRRNPAGKRG